MKVICGKCKQEMTFKGGISEALVVDLCFNCETCNHAIRIRVEDDLQLILKLRKLYWGHSMTEKEILKRLAKKVEYAQDSLGKGLIQAVRLNLKKALDIIEKEWMGIKSE